MADFEVFPEVSPTAERSFWSPAASRRSRYPFQLTTPYRKTRPKSRALEERCRWGRPSSYLDRFPLRHSRSNLLVSVAHHFVMPSLTGCCALAAVGPRKPSQHFLAALPLIAETAPSGGTLEHFALRRAMSRMS